MKLCRLPSFAFLALVASVACADTKRFVLDRPDAASGAGGQEGGAGAGGMGGSAGSGGAGAGGMSGAAGAGGSAGSGLPEAGAPLDAGSDAGDAAADASL